MPAHFELFQPADVYVPFGPWAATLPEDRGWHPGIFPVARLKEGVTLEQARVEMDGISAQLEAEYPRVEQEPARAGHAGARSARQEHSARDPAADRRRRAGAADCLCQRRQSAARPRGRSPEGDRGAHRAWRRSRLRIVRQLIVESVVLSCVGGGGRTAGHDVGRFVSDRKRNRLAAARFSNVGIEWPVVVVRARARGRAPASSLVSCRRLHATQTPIRASLNEESRGGSGSVRQRKLRSSLVVLEVGVALVLLVGAGLLVRSFAALTTRAAGLQCQPICSSSTCRSRRRDIRTT